MNGYERLNSKEADLLWDRERFDLTPEQERELVVDEINRSLEFEAGDPCNPNSEDCFGVQTIPNEISRW